MGQCEQESTFLSLSDDAVSLNQSQWHARLSLALGKTSRGVRLLESSHSGPLYVQKPFYPEGEDLAHIYVLHPPGGLVSGDKLGIDVNVQQESRVLLTTPGAGRVYRARADRTVQHQCIDFDLAENASAEWFPLETIVYPGAFGKLTTRINLQANSQFIGWEITCLGLPASQQYFASGELSQRFEIYQQGRLQLLENLKINASDEALLQGKAGLQGFAVNAIMIAGPFVDEQQAEILKTQLRELTPSSDVLLAVTHVANFIVIRYLGGCAQSARQLFVRCWQCLRPSLLQRDICEPRIWAT